MSRRDRATSVRDGGAHIAALDHPRSDEFRARLEVRRPQTRPLAARALGDRQKPLNLDLRGREQRGGRCRRYRQDGMLHEQLGGKPAHPAEELPEPAAPNELEMPLDQQLRHHVRVPSSRGVLDRLLREPLRATPGRRAAAELARGLSPELQLQNLAEQWW